MAELLLQASEFVISCGTVTVDQKWAKVLLIRLCEKDEYMLPKGRKDIGETLEAAALRETLEETGYAAGLLPLHTRTQATSPSASNVKRRTNTEPIYMSQRVKNGIFKIIFWYVAKGDSTVAEQQRLRQPGEDFESMWISWDVAENTLSFHDDRQIFRAAMEALESEKELQGPRERRREGKD